MNNAHSSFLPINQDRLFKKTEAKLEKQGPTYPQQNQEWDIICYITYATSLLFFVMQPSKWGGTLCGTREAILWWLKLATVFIFRAYL